MQEKSSSENISTKQQRIAKLAGEAPDMAFTSLAHHIDLDWLYVAYQNTRKDGAVGIDGQTAKDYEANLMENLRTLIDRAKSGTYKAPPVSEPRWRTIQVALRETGKYKIRAKQGYFPD